MHENSTVNILIVFIIFGGEHKIRGIVRIKNRQKVKTFIFVFLSKCSYINLQIMIITAEITGIKDIIYL